MEQRYISKVWVGPGGEEQPHNVSNLKLPRQANDQLKFHQSWPQQSTQHHLIDIMIQQHILLWITSGEGSTFLKEKSCFLSDCLQYTTKRKVLYRKKIRWLGFIGSYWLWEVVLLFIWESGWVIAKLSNNEYIPARAHSIQTNSAESDPQWHHCHH